MVDNILGQEDEETMAPKDTKEENPVGRRLLIALKNTGHDQVWLAKESGVPPASISRIIHGDRLPNLVTIRKLADALHVPWSWLTGEDPMGDGSLDPDLQTFFKTEWHALSPEDKTWFRGTVDMLRRKGNRSGR